MNYEMGLLFRSRFTDIAAAFERKCLILSQLSGMTTSQAEGCITYRAQRSIGTWQQEADYLIAYWASRSVREQLL